MRGGADVGEDEEEVVRGGVDVRLTADSCRLLEPFGVSRFKILACTRWISQCFE